MPGRQEMFVEGAVEKVPTPCALEARQAAAYKRLNFEEVSPFLPWPHYIVGYGSILYILNTTAS